MLKSTFIATGLLLAASVPAMAETWNVTEVSAAGVAYAQGTWTLTVDGAGKVTGKATLQLQNGNPVSYSFDGALANSTYTLTLTDRTDEKHGCVWTGAQQGQNAKVLNGDAKCDSNLTFRIKASS